jgi:dethiobiotin synthetase
MKSFFISGTDTGVGKTAIAAALFQALQPQSYRYWKPIQTGTPGDDDTATVQLATKIDPAKLFPPAYRFLAPLSPHLAAKLEKRSIEPAVLLEKASLYAANGPAVIEGAGGLLVPICPGFLQIDFIKAAKLPVLLIAEDKLGAINHTLLSLEAAKTRGIPVLGVLLNLSTDFAGNDQSIEEYGSVKVLGRVPKFSDLREMLTQTEAFFQRIVQKLLPQLERLP